MKYTLQSILPKFNTKMHKRKNSVLNYNRNSHVKNLPKK